MRVPLLVSMLLLTAGLAGCLTDDGGLSLGGAGRNGGDADDGARALPEWPSADEAAIRPGVPIGVWTTHDLNGAGTCTSNFVFMTPDHTRLFLGTAAHCLDTQELGTDVVIAGGAATGTHVYNSWFTMDDVDEDSAGARAYNDFALIEIDEADWGLVNPAVRHFGGPHDLADSSGVTPGDKILSYGNSALRLHVEPSSWKEGYVDSRPDPWTIVATMLTPGIFGDSGSAAMTADGQALGIVVTVGVNPTGGVINGITSLALALAYAAEHADLDVRLMTADLVESGFLPG